MKKMHFLFVSIFFFLLCGPVLDVQASGKKGTKRKQTASSTVLQPTIADAVVLGRVEVDSEQYRVKALEHCIADLTERNELLVANNIKLIEKNKALSKEVDTEKKKSSQFKDEKNKALQLLDNERAAHAKCIAKCVVLEQRLKVQEQLKSKNAELENFKKVENFFFPYDE